MSKKKIAERFANMAMNPVDKDALTRLAFPRCPAYVEHYEKHPNLIKMTCSCGGFSSEYGKKHPKPIRHENGDLECPHCHQIIENCGKKNTWGSTYFDEERSAVLYEHHDGCDFARYFYIEYVWWKDNKEPHLYFYEMFRHIYDENMDFYAMRKQKVCMCWNLRFKPESPLKMYWDWNYYNGRRTYDMSVYGAMGSLSERFDNFHITDTEVATSGLLRDWIEEVRKPNFDHRLETLLVKGQMEAFYHFGYWKSFKVEYWPQLKMAMRHGYKETTREWFDDLSIMEQLGISITEASNIFPKDFKSQHQTHIKQLQIKHEKEALKQRIQRALDQLPEKEKKYAKSMAKRIAKYASSTITAPGFTLTPLRTIREFADEGSAMNHCLYTNEYYKDSDYIVFSAKNEFEQRLETVTVSIKHRKIVASFGKNNKFSSYHHRIAFAVEKAMNNILNGKPTTIKSFPKEVEQKEFDRFDITEQSRLPSIFHHADETEHFDDIRFKKAYQSDGSEVIIALKVYSDSEENFLFSDNEHDADAFTITKARVIGIYDTEGRLTDMSEANSYHDRSFSYKVGTDCAPSNPKEKASGIYCFNNFAGAAHYWKNLEVQFTRATA